MPKTTILIIEDENDIVTALSIKLKSEGYNILCAYNGDDAIKLALRERPHLVLLDIALPNEDGFSVARQLRKHESTAAIPVVFLTALASDEDREQAQRVGAAGFITKPFKWEQLMKKIHEITAQVI